MPKTFYEIFRAGNYPQRSVTQEEVQQIADNYDPNWLAAPVVLDHFRLGGPAFAWIDELKAEGESLLASFRDVSDTLKSLVAEKKYQRHSIELFEDLDDKGLYIKALALLGYETPAVKGMEPIKFQESEKHKQDAKTFELSEQMKSKEVKTFEELQSENEQLQNKLKTYEQESEQFKTENERLKFQQEKDKFESFLDKNIQGDKPKLPPKLKQPLLNLFSQIHQVPKPESADKGPVELVKEVVEGLPANDALFQEKATKDKATGEEEKELTPQQIAEKAREYRDAQYAKGNKISFTQAVNHVKEQATTDE